MFERSFAKFEDLNAVHVGDELLRFLAEVVDLQRLFQLLKEGFLVRVAVELLNQLFDLFFAICILLFDCGRSMPGIL